MKTGIYIYAGAGNSNIGVEKKINEQIATLAESFSITKVVIEKEKTNPVKSICWRLPFFSFGRKYADAVAQIKKLAKPDFVYIRDMLWDRRCYSFMTGLRKYLPEAKIMLELPAYPYHKEVFHSPTLWPNYIKDYFYCPSKRKVADRIVTYSLDDEIFGIPTIKTMNGIIVDNITSDYEKMEYSDEIRMIAVASMQKHHGYERIIKGMYEYKKGGGDRKIKLYLVGEGSRIGYYKKLVATLGMGDDVIFCGKKAGKDLEEMYDMADIGLGSFGFHLIGDEDQISSTLKTREYLAYGLPFVSACTEDVFMNDSECEFYLNFPDDDTTVSMDKIIEMYDNLKSSYTKAELRRHIHEYAKQKIDMPVVMKPIIDYIEE